MKNQFYHLLVYLLFCFLPSQMQSQNWVPQAIDLLPVDYAVYSISVVDENVVWAVAYDRTAGVPVAVDHIIKVLRTTDSGASWDVFDVTEAIGRKSFDIVAFNQDTAIITTLTSGDNGFVGGVFKTENGGGSWTQKSLGYTGSVWVRFFNQTDGVIININSMATTNDGGETWLPVPSANIPVFQTDEYTLISTGTNSCQVIGDHIWFGTNMGRVYRSQDKGLNWEVFDSSLGSSATILSEAFKDTLNGIALDISSPITKFSKTANGGETWTNVSSSPDLRIRNISYLPGTTSTLIGTSDISSNPITAYSVDFGETWKVIDENIPLRATQFISSTVGWATKSRISSSNQAAMYKWDDSDIFDCNPASKSFSNNPLTHSGSGSSSTVVAFDPGSKTPSFTISGLNTKINGNPNSRFIDEVTVTYVYENGTTGTYGAFSGSNTTSVTVDILKTDIESVTVSLADGYDGNFSGTLSVSLTDIDYCGVGSVCPDADNDGVCDVDDVCPGGNDNLDADGDGVPDDCDSCTNETSSFDPSLLTHQGTGSSVSSVTIPVGNTEVNFTINGLNAKTNGNPSKRFIDQITVTDNNGVSYGTFNGDIQSSVNIEISGGVESVMVSLTDIYDGDTGTEVLNVSMSDVTTCVPPPSPPASILSSNDVVPESFNRTIAIYPNPTRDIVNLELKNYLEQRVSISIYNNLGQRVLYMSEQELNNTVLSIDLINRQLPDGIYILAVSTVNGSQTKQFVLQQ